MTRRPDKPKKGDPILADHISYLYEMLEEIGEINVVPPLMYSGDTIYLAEEPGFWAVIDGAPSAGKYPWTEQIPAPSGGWTDGVRSGTTSANYAYEFNGSTATISDKIVWMRRTVANDYRFAYGACS